MIARYVRPRRRRLGGPRRGQDIDSKYVEFLHVAGICAACILLADRLGEPAPIAGNCEGAHTQNNGESSKGPDSSRAPLCRRHHDEYDAGRERFERRYGLDMQDIAAAWYAMYLRKSQSTAYHHRRR